MSARRSKMKYSVDQDLQDFYENNKWEINKLKGEDVVMYIKENFKLSIIESLEWHIEDCNLSLRLNKNDYHTDGMLKAFEAVLKALTEGVEK